MTDMVDENKNQQSGAQDKDLEPIEKVRKLVEYRDGVRVQAEAMRTQMRELDDEVEAADKAVIKANDELTKSLGVFE